MERRSAVLSGFPDKKKETVRSTFMTALWIALTMTAAQGLAYAGPLEAETKTVVIPVEGMTCASCVAQVKRALKAVDGVVEVKVALEQRSARVRYIEGRVTPERLVEAINKSGYKAGTPKTEGAP
jgi:copper chaperone CopZ